MPHRREELRERCRAALIAHDRPFVETRGEWDTRFHTAVAAIDCLLGPLADAPPIAAQARLTAVHWSYPMTEILHTGRHLELVKEGGWEFVRRHKASAVVVIIAVTPADELLLVEQHRVPVGTSVIELPAGLVGDEDASEDLLVAANRELDEETGWTAAWLHIVNRGPSSAGLTSEVVTMVHAGDLTRTSAGGGVPGEGIIVRAIPRALVVDWLGERAAAGCLIDHKVFAGLWWLGQRQGP